MKTIPLSRGLEAIVDDEDYEWLSQWKWYALKSPGTYYVVREEKKGSFIYMHRLIMGLRPGDGSEVDHINRNGVDNRRGNLRIVTHRENAYNQRLAKGYCWSKQKQKFMAYIKIKGKRKHLGFYDESSDAHRAYLMAKAKYHRIKGEVPVDIMVACLNPV